ncbi:unnamed protein product, partial [marine sediment metagenome]
MKELKVHTADGDTLLLLTLDVEGSDLEFFFKIPTLAILGGVSLLDDEATHQRKLQEKE